MPIYQIYILVIVLALLLISGGLAYYFIQGDMELLPARGGESEEVTGGLSGTEGQLNENQKEDILRSLTLPGGESGTIDTTGQTGSGAGQPTPATGSTGGTQSGTTQQQGGSQSTTGSQQTSGGTSDGGGDLTDKESILESLGSDTGEELSDEEKQSILESLQ